jgi:chromosome partitioning protein
VIADHPIVLGRGNAVIVVSAALKGGVGKTTTSVYLAALAAASDRRGVFLVDADSQASAAEWVEEATDERLQRLDLVEAPTERLLTKALDRVGPDDVAIVDTPPGHERLTAKALGRADAVVVPTRVGGVETTRAQAVLDMVPEGTPAGLVICSARTFTRDYDEAIATWGEDGVRVWGTVPERVAIAAGPERWLAFDGVEAYRGVWRKVQRAAR